MYLVDGFNLAYAIPYTFHFLQDREKEAAQEGLVEVLTDWQTRQKEKPIVHLFWDGAAPGSENRRFESGEAEANVNQAPQDIVLREDFHLHYAGDYSADAYIEVFLSGLYFPSKCTVVSSDKGVKIRAKKYSAKIITSDDFRDNFL